MKKIIKNSLCALSILALNLSIQAEVPAQYDSQNNQSSVQDSYKKVDSKTFFNDNNNLLKNRQRKIEIKKIRTQKSDELEKPIIQKPIDDGDTAATPEITALYPETDTSIKSENPQSANLQSAITYEDNFFNKNNNLLKNNKRRIKIKESVKSKLVKDNGVTPDMGHMYKEEDPSIAVSNPLIQAA